MAGWCTVAAETALQDDSLVAAVVAVVSAEPRLETQNSGHLTSQWTNITATDDEDDDDDVDET